MKGIRAIVYGVGRVGKLATRLMVEKGIEIVGAVNRAGPKVNRDLGEVAELGYRLNVTVSDDADAVLSQAAADVVLVCVYDDMERMFPIYKNCIEHGLNVISVGAHASYPWRIAPEITATLDRLAKTHKVTITGSGNQDFFMVNVASLASGVCHRIDAITYRSLTDVNAFGPEVAEIAHVGETRETYNERAIAAHEQPLSVYTTFWDNLSADLGLQITDVRQNTEPLVGERELVCTSLNATVSAGRLIGIAQRIEVATQEGITMLGEYILKVCAEDEEEYKAWSIRGEPDLNIRLDKLSPGFTTASQPVNRIPDVINSKPGFVTLEQLPKLRYRVNPLSSYLTADIGA